MAFLARLGSINEDRTTWMVLLFLLLGVLAPTTCLLWFMNEAARNQALAARHDVSDAYRGQIRLLSDQIEGTWASRLKVMESKASGGMVPASDFRELLSTGVADSVILLKSDGSLAYPFPNARPFFDPISDRQDWVAAEALEGRRAFSEAADAYRHIARGEADREVRARALQAQVRCLVQSGNREAAIALVQQHFLRGHLARVSDAHGRLIAGDAQLLSLQLMKSSDPRFQPAVQSLASLLSLYPGEGMPPAQRIFLMDELRVLAPEVELTTYSAERLAAEFLEQDTVRVDEPGLHRSRLPEVWKLASGSGRFVALYRSDTLTREMNRIAADANRSPGLKSAILPPGSSGTGESVPAGDLLPGWRISFSFVGGQSFDDAAHRRVALYLWVGSLVIAVMTLSGVVVGRIFRRQARLARLKTDLVAAVSHELKTPLASMRLLVDSLLDDEQPDARKTRDYLELIAKENLRLSRLIENFLAFSRLERNRHRFEFRSVEPGQVIQAAVEAGGERFHSNGCRLEVAVGSGLPTVRADEDAMVTVLLNLLDNAYKYTAADKHIFLRVFGQGGRVVFAVEDNGIGIAGREQKRIFRRFYQVDRRLARESGGCGLGLSIVEFIVQAHGGRVEVKSQPGKGSTFSVCLPVPAALGGGTA